MMVMLLQLSLPMVSSIVFSNIKQFFSELLHYKRLTPCANLANTGKWCGCVCASVC